MRSITKEQTCGTCIFCDRSKQLGQGRCREGPPTAFALPVKGPLNAVGVQQMAFYPPVTLSDQGCGAYQAALRIGGDESED